MAQLRDIVIDCARPAPLARFWAALLDDYEVAPYDDAEIARLRSLGIEDVEGDPSVVVQPVGERPGVRFWFQRVPEPKVVKNRVHVDVAAKEPERELARLLELGASVVADRGKLVVLADPEGNEFCLLR